MTGNYLLDTGVLGNSGSFYANAVVIDSATSPLTISSAYVMSRSIPPSKYRPFPRCFDSRFRPVFNAKHDHVRVIGIRYIYPPARSHVIHAGKRDVGQHSLAPTTTTYWLASPMG